MISKINKGDFFQRYGKFLHISKIVNMLLISLLSILILCDSKSIIKRPPADLNAMSPNNTWSKEYCDYEQNHLLCATQQPIRCGDTFKKTPYHRGREAFPLFPIKNAQTTFNNIRANLAHGMSPLGPYMHNCKASDMKFMVRDIVLLNDY